MIKSNIVINGAHIEIESNTAQELKEILSFLITKSPSQKEKPTSINKLSLKSHKKGLKNLRKPRFNYAAWSEKDILRVIKIVMAQGKSKIDLGEKVYNDLRTYGDNQKRSLQNVSAYAHVFHGYFYQGITKRINGAMLEVLKKHNFSSFTTEKTDYSQDEKVDKTIERLVI